MRRFGAAHRGLVLTAVVALAAGCGSPARHVAVQSARVPAAAVSGASTFPGELAFVAHNELFLTGGPAGRLHRVVLPGIPFAPAWSADHRWLAVEVSKRPAAGAAPYAYLGEPAALWLVSAVGTVVRRLSARSWEVSSFAWSPAAGTLATIAYLPQARQARRYIAATLNLAGRSHVVAAGSYLSGLAWSPDGKLLATGASIFTGTGYRSVLELLHPRGGHVVVVSTSKGNVLELASWWPGSAGLLYWTDPQGSASISADGLPLDSIGVPGRQARQLVSRMLVHGSWLAFAPGGRELAAVSGGSRVIWSGGKHIVICQHTGRCAAVPQPAGVVSLDPSWSPGGTRLVFARLSASGPFGAHGHADFSPSWIRRWQATSRLWLASATGGQPHPLTAAGPGAIAPVWGSDGSILFIRGDRVWLLPPGGHAAAPVTGPLGALSGPAYQRTYYGYVPYPQLTAWTLALPLGTAGPS